MKSNLLKFLGVLFLVLAVGCTADTVNDELVEDISVIIEKGGSVTNTKVLSVLNDSGFVGKCGCYWTGNYGGVDYTIVRSGDDYYLSTGGGVWTSVSIGETIIYDL